MQGIGPFRGLGARFTLATHDPALTAALGVLYAPLAEPSAVEEGGAPVGGDAATSADGPSAAGTSPVPIVLAPPTPGELWTLSVDGRVVVRSSTPAGVLRMLLRSVEDLVRRDHDDPDRQAAAPSSSLHLSATAIEVAGIGTLLLTDQRIDRDALLIRLLHDRDDVRYLGAGAVHLAVGDLTLTSAATPLALHRDHWEVLTLLGALVPAGVHPYLDLLWPLPAAELAPIAEHAQLEVVCLVETDDAAASAAAAAADAAPSRVDGAVEPIGPAACVTRLLDRLPSPDRTGLATQRIEQVASVVERVAAVRVAAVADPPADADAVIAAVRDAARVPPAGAGDRAVVRASRADPGAP